MIAACHDPLQERQEAHVERIIAFAHPLVLAVCGKEELLEIVAPDRQEPDLVKELLRRKAKARRLQHRTQLKLFGQGMAELALAFLGFFHLPDGARVFLILCDKREHDRQRPPIGRAQKRLKLHPHDTRLIKSDADRAPAKRRVGFVLGLHIGQDLVRPDVERAENHALVLGGIHHPRIERR